jgi:putative acyl-CoA dehydrogenase
MPDTIGPFTHTVENQPPPLVDVNLFALDKPLQEALHREGGKWGRQECEALGARIGSTQYQHWIRQANTWLPELHTHDRFGNRVDEVEFCDAWHALLATAKQAGIHALPWGEAKPGAHVVRAALAYLFGQGDQGPSCPIAMTFASFAALRHQPDVAEDWIPKLLVRDHDARFAPLAQKKAALIGMAMTEKQGGSDVRANSTRAQPLGPGGPGNAYELTGHKWFCSAPMCDAFLTLAYTDGGLSCFLVPRFLPDGERNRFFIQRLKDKLGNRSNASSEIEYRQTWGQMVGREGRGVATILDMVHHTRLECVIGSAALMRQALTQALHHGMHRRAFQRRLIDQALMRALLADLAIENEAVVTSTLRLARAFDQAAADERQRTFARIATPVAKYWTCKRTSQAVLEGLECLGGSGYVEEWPLARIYREAPLNGIWEGSANVICLDVLRALQREPAAGEIFVAELTRARGADRRFDDFLRALAADLARTDLREELARDLVERMAIGLEAALLLQHAPEPVARAYVSRRVVREGGAAYGAIGPGVAVDRVLERALF